MIVLTINSILSRAHSNYLAQINIGMNERAEQTNDVLGRLTVLGTIVLPMNIVTGMWGMNCLGTLDLSLIYLFRPHLSLHINPPPYPPRNSNGWQEGRWQDIG